ncbi:hypothetical protein F5Y04DRAFT_282205 [Hypomontagnella monticulosa]|nr:hypothetical protein F5Y04DRAFT_282205 [Hypomontagnella monticulosa]
MGDQNPQNRPIFVFGEDPNRAGPSRWDLSQLGDVLLQAERDIQADRQAGYDRQDQLEREREVAEMLDQDPAARRPEVEYPDVVLGGLGEGPAPPSQTPKRRPPPPQLLRTPPPGEPRPLVPPSIKEAQVRSIRRRQAQGYRTGNLIRDAEIHQLARLEGASINLPTRPRPWANGLLVRLMKHSGAYWFLAVDGGFYRSMSRYGLGVDLSYVSDRFVPWKVRFMADPYRQLCNRHAQGPGGNNVP